MSASAALNGDHHSRRLVADLFVDKIEEAETLDNPPCPVFVYCALRVLHRYGLHGAQDSDIRYLRRHHPQVIRVCARFLMVPRTPDKRESLVDNTRSRRCACALRSSALLRELHRPRELLLPVVAATPGLTQTLVWFAQVVYSAIRDCGAAIQSPLKRARLFERNALLACWPASEEDMVPYRLEFSVHNICAWGVHFHQEAQLFLLSDIYTILAQPRKPSILLSYIIPNAIMPLVGKITPWYAGEPGLANARIYIGFLDVMRWSFQRMYELPPAQFLHRPDPYFDAHAFIDLCNTTMNVLADIKHTYGDELDVLVRTQRSNVYVALAKAAGYCHNALALPHDLAQYGNAVLRRSEAWNRTNVMQELQRFERNLYEPHLCGNRSDCTRVSRPDGRALFVCSGCSHMFYCSRECQKAAWKHERLAHRHICAIMQSVLGPTDEVLRDRFGRLQFCGLSFVEEGVEMDLAAQLLSHLSGLYTG